MQDWPRLLRLEATLLLLALGHLTRLPMPDDLPRTDDLMTRSARYDAVVGALVGAAGAAVLWTAGQVLPQTVAALLALAVTLVVTGAAQERGLAAAAEALCRGETRAARLLLIDAPELGTHGALTLGLTLALKIALLASLPLGVAAAALVVAHATGRMTTVHTAATCTHARSTGMQAFVPGVTSDGYRVALASTLLLAALLTLVTGPLAAAAGMLAAIALGQLARKLLIRRLGGYTGAGLGGAAQMGELGVLLGVALLM